MVEVSDHIRGQEPDHMSMQSPLRAAQVSTWSDEGDLSAVWNLLLNGRPRWMDEAACRGKTDLFFNGRGNAPLVAEAKQVCATCLVLEECREYVLVGAKRREQGVWGGMSERDRRRFRAQRAQERARCGTDSGYYRHRKLDEDACVECRAAHSAAETRRQRATQYASQALRRKARRVEGWCWPCSEWKHTKCRLPCTCTECRESVA